MRKIQYCIHQQIRPRRKRRFDLMDEVETKLGLTVTPLSFPIGMGYDFQGIYNLWEQNINLFSGTAVKTLKKRLLSPMFKILN
jgi:peptide chain release factor 3